MAITDDLMALSPVANTPQTSQQPSWVKELIDKRYQPKTERLKRSPVGFNFTREPFDPSSYYRALGQYRDISRNATNVTRQEVSNREQSEREAQMEADRQAALNAGNGVDPRFTYSDDGSFDVSGSSKRYGLKGVSSNVSKVADNLGSRFGIKTIGGRGPGSVPGSDHPKGRALDFMINNVSNGKARGDALSSYAIKNYKALNVKYVIWNRYIWQPGRGWHKYSGPSDHTDHVHVSFNK